MREKLYQIIKSPTEGNSETTLYDYFMMVVIILSLLPLTYKPEAEPYWVIYVEHIAVTIFIIDYILRWFVADYEYPGLKIPFCSMYINRWPLLIYCLYCRAYW